MLLENQCSRHRCIFAGLCCRRYEKRVAGECTAKTLCGIRWVQAIKFLSLLLLLLSSTRLITMSFVATRAMLQICYFIEYRFSFVTYKIHGLEQNVSWLFFSAKYWIKMSKATWCTCTQCTLAHIANINKPYYTRNFNPLTFRSSGKITEIE